jgi:hypothetical protein
VQRLILGFVNCRTCEQFWVGPRIAGQQRELDAIFFAKACKLVDTIGPIGAAAQKTDNDEFGVDCRLLKPEIN